MQRGRAIRLVRGDGQSMASYLWPVRNQEHSDADRVRAAIAAGGVASVQVVDPDGRVFAEDVNGRDYVDAQVAEEGEGLSPSQDPSPAP